MIHPFFLQAVQGRNKGCNWVVQRQPGAFLLPKLQFQFFGNGDSDMGARSPAEYRASRECDGQFCVEEEGLSE
ncbi:unnamed protein product [Prunus armeniaca]|uniref:Uncharacterized protein n=1 Tax=Prunus armeniaca TaxID=36596 RepID=A0A6J5XBQ4_PRUAR|nr:unnamed protein product [Prunus armeniaca]